MRIKAVISYELDPERPEPLTAAQRLELAALAALPDGPIDTSDIPPLSEAFWRNAVRGRFYWPMKR